MNQLMFKNLEIGQQFRFPGTPSVWQKVSARKYRKVLADGRSLSALEYQVGSINVKVEDWE